MTLKILERSPKWEEVITAFLKNTLGEALLNVLHNSLTGLEESLDECGTKIDEEFQKLQMMLDRLHIKKDSQLAIAYILDNFFLAAKSLFNTVAYKTEEEQDSYQVTCQHIFSNKFAQKVEYYQEIWHKYVTKIQENWKSFPKDEELFKRSILTQGYELILDFIINLRKDQILSEEELSDYLNDQKDGRIITYHSSNKYNPKSGSLDIKKSLEKSNAINGFTEILKCE
jgi:hypothetical protein